jgi:putative heme iron utilization protein
VPPSSCSPNGGFIIAASGFKKLNEEPAHETVNNSVLANHRPFRILPTMSNSNIAETVAAALAENPRAMTMQLAQKLRLPEADIVRHLPGTQSRELDLARSEELIRAFEPVGKVHVICTNGAVTLEANGEFGNFSSWGEFFNVQTPTLDMHIRHKNISAAFAVEKPSHMDGVNTLSIQFFDLAGASAFKVFLTMGGNTANPKRVSEFNDIREKFAKKA